MKPKDLSSLQIYSENGKLVRTDVTFRTSRSLDFAKGRPKTHHTSNSHLHIPDQSIAPQAIRCLPITESLFAKRPSSRSGRLVPIHAKDQIFELIDEWKEKTSKVYSPHLTEAAPEEFGKRTITIMPKAMVPNVAEIDLFNSPMYRKQQCPTPALRPASPVVHRGRERQLKESYEAALNNLGVDEMSIASKVSREDGIDQRLGIAKFGLSTAGRQEMWRRYESESGMPSNQAIYSLAAQSSIHRMPSQSSEAESQVKLSKKAKALVRKYTSGVVSRHERNDSPSAHSNLYDENLVARIDDIKHEALNLVEPGMCAFDVYPSMASTSVSDQFPVPEKESERVRACSPMSDTSRQPTAPSGKAAHASGRFGSGLEDDSSAADQSMQDSLCSTGTGSVYALDRPQLSEKAIYVPPTWSPEQLRSPLNEILSHKIGPAIRAATADRRLKREKEKKKISLMFRSAGISMPKSSGAFPLVGPKDVYEKPIASDKGTYKIPDAFMTTASHLYTPKCPTADCAHCFRVATLLCEKCCKAFCLACWTLVPHHQFNDVADMIISNQKAELQEGSQSLSQQLSPPSIPLLPPNTGISEYSSATNRPISPIGTVSVPMLPAMGQDSSFGLWNQQFSSSLEVSNTSGDDIIGKIGPESTPKSVSSKKSGKCTSSSPSGSPSQSSKKTSRNSSPVANSPERIGSPKLQTRNVNSSSEAFSPSSENGRAREELQSDAMAAVNMAKLESTGRAKSPPHNNVSVASIELKPITPEFAFIDDKGRVIPRLEKPCSSHTAAGGFHGFTAAPQTIRLGSAPSPNALTGSHNFASAWAEFDLYKATFKAEDELDALTPARKFELREAEIKRIGRQAATAAERLRLAKKYDDIGTKDKVKNAAIRLEMQKHRSDLASTL